jgi:hypothetical protein
LNWKYQIAGLMALVGLVTAAVYVHRTKAEPVAPEPKLTALCGSNATLAREVMKQRQGGLVGEKAMLDAAGGYEIGVLIIQEAYRRPAVDDPIQQTKVIEQFADDVSATCLKTGQKGT